MKIRFSTANDIALELFPPKPVKSVIPEWYKNTPHTIFDPKNANAYEGNPQMTPYTVTSCIPVRDYMTSGYVILNDVDRVITPLEDRDPVDFSDHSPIGPMMFHPHAQCPVKIQGRDRHYFKVPNPWDINTPRGYSCLFYQPAYLFESRFQMLPAIVDTDRYNMPINFIGAITSPESFVLEAGTPLMVVFPFKRDEWESEVKLQSPKHDRLRLVYLNKIYQRFFHNKKVYR